MHARKSDSGHNGGGRDVLVEDEITLLLGPSQLVVNLYLGSLQLGRKRDLFTFSFLLLLLNRSQPLSLEQTLQLFCYQFLLQLLVVYSNGKVDC